MKHGLAATRGGGGDAEQCRDFMRLVVQKEVLFDDFTENRLQIRADLEHPTCGAAPGKTIDVRLI
jgi:hypothetical protein